MFGETTDYIDRSDDGDGVGNYTVFHLKPLTVNDFFYVEGVLDAEPIKYGTRAKRTLERGLKGWSNFIGVIKNSLGQVVQEIAYSAENVSAIPVAVRERIGQRIMHVSVLPDGMETELKASVRTAQLNSKSKRDDFWNCDNCKASGWQRARSCSLKEYDPENAAQPAMKEKYLAQWHREQAKKGKEPKTQKGGGHLYELCPVGQASRRSWAMYGLVQECKAMNVMPCQPPVLMEQPYFFYQAKRVIDHEEYLVNKGQDSDEKPAKKPKAEKPLAMGKGKPNSNADSNLLATVRDRIKRGRV